MGAIPSRSATASSSRSDGAGLTAFALRLAKHLAADGGGGRNLVFSPLSIYSTLALLATGARGSTLQELLVALGSGPSRDELAAFVRGLVERALADQSASGGPAVAFASGVWHDTAWEPLPGFVKAAAESYKAEARAVDFRNTKSEAIAEINRWVAASTNNLIDAIVDPTSVHDATYFKGKWEDPFDKKLTTVAKFYRRDGTAVDAPFMRSWSRKLIAVHRGFKALKLRYQSPSSQAGGGGGVNVPRYAMCVFLPDARNGLPALTKKVASSPAFWRDHLPDEAVDVGRFGLPKFKMEFSHSVKRVLEEDMKIKAAFDGRRADLSDMAMCRDDPGRKLAVEDVLHKAVIEVNEEGTVAAAVTACLDVEISCAWWTPLKVDFVADHPFMFFVIEEVSGAIVFVGHVLDPSNSGR